MKLNSTISLLLLASLTAFTGCDSDAEPAAAESNIPELLGLGDDWYPVSDGVWAQDDEDGTVKHLGIGEAGRRHSLAAMEEAGLVLLDDYAADPTPKRKAQLDEFEREFTKLRLSPVANIDDLLVTFRSCELTAAGTANVVPVQGGIKATASANYRNTCNTTAKSVSTYAYTKANYEAQSHSCGPKSGLQVACNSSRTSYGSWDCYGFASANFAGLYISQTGYTCGAGGSPPQWDECANLPPGTYCR